MTATANNALPPSMSEPLRAEPGVVPRWTPMIDAIQVVEIDAPLDEQGAKRGSGTPSAQFSDDWLQAQLPY